MRFKCAQRNLFHACNLIRGLWYNGAITCSLDLLRDLWAPLRRILRKGRTLRCRDHHRVVEGGLGRRLFVVSGVVLCGYHVLNFNGPSGWRIYSSSCRFSSGEVLAMPSRPLSFNNLFMAHPDNNCTVPKWCANEATHLKCNKRRCSLPPVYM